MSNDDVIKNPNRGKAKPPIQAEPEYVRLEKTPIKMERRLSPSILASKTSQQVNANKDFAGVDNQVFDENDEVKLDGDHIIDNNDWVFPPEPQQQSDGDIKYPPMISEPRLVSASQSTSPASILGQPKVGEYILMVLGKIVDTGSIDQVENVARAILYGENEQFTGRNITEDDLVILKRIGLKGGI